MICSVLNLSRYLLIEMFVKWFQIKGLELASTKYQVIVLLGGNVSMSRQKIHFYIKVGNSMQLGSRDLNMW